MKQKIITIFAIAALTFFAASCSRECSCVSHGTISQVTITATTIGKCADLESQFTSTGSPFICTEI